MSGMLQRSSPQTGRNTPDLGYFDSDNFQLLELTQERKDERLRVERVKARKERANRGPLLERFCSPELGYYSQLYRADGNPKPKKVPVPPQNFFGLRRPLNLPDQRIVAAIPSYEKDHKEWADKPYSTVYPGWNGYKGQFPLLMHLSSESEDMDVTVVQTETRRMSLVTTDYSKGTIRLADDDEEVKYAVFPILHRVVESEDEDSDEDTDTKSDSDDDGDDDDDGTRTPKNKPPPLLPQDVLDRLAAIAAQREENGDESDDDEEAEPPPGWLEHRTTRMHAERRLSITTRPCPEKPRMLKRRSLDYGALFYHHEMDKRQEMGSIGEDGEDGEEDASTTMDTATDGFSKVPQAGTWAMAAEAKEQEAKLTRKRKMAIIRRRAELEMKQMEAQLPKLEDF